MQYARKTTVIFFTIFAVSYTALNFLFATIETRSLSALSIRSASNTIPDVNDRYISVHLLPLSPFKVAQAEKVPATSPILTVPGPLFNLTIPSLGIKAPIVLEPTTNEDRIFNQLESGVVHYATTPLPGQSGTAIIIGHSSVYPWYKGKYGYVFSSLSKLKTGDIIQVDNDGLLLSYRVSNSITFSPKTVTSTDYQLREFETSNGSSIVLMTCWPNGTNAKRVAVKADLI